MLSNGNQMGFNEEAGHKADKRQKQVLKIASETQVRCFSNIIANLIACNSQVCSFRAYLQKTLPLLGKDRITMKGLSLVSLNVKSNTQFFASAMKQLEGQLKIYGFELPEMEQVKEFVRSVSSSQDRLTLFFHKVEHFFEPHAFYIKDNPKKIEICMEDNNSQQNVLTFKQISEIWRRSRRQIAYFHYNMLVFSQIFLEIMWLFIFSHQKILLEIFKLFKDTAGESVMLKNYTEMIHNTMNALINIIVSRYEVTKKKAATQQQLTRPPTQEKSDPNQARKQLQLTFKQKALSYLQIIFLPRPTKKGILAREQQQQQLRHPKQQ